MSDTLELEFNARSDATAAGSPLLRLGGAERGKILKEGSSKWPIAAPIISFLI